MREALFSRGLVRNENGTAESPSISRFSLRPAVEAAMRHRVIALLETGQRPYSHRGLLEMRSLDGNTMLPPELSKALMPSAHAMVGNGDTQVGHSPACKAMRTAQWRQADAQIHACSQATTDSILGGLHRCQACVYLHTH